MNQVLGAIIGNLFGAPTLGYNLGAWKFCALVFGTIFGVVGLLKLAGVEAPEPPKAAVCVKTEVKTYRAYGYNAELGWISFEQTGPVCMKWERPQ